ncbi:hypothetical protein JHK82_033732 [Glycine max]|uniref:Uncharacterized protein n=1 Tax=Glycine max TaxID=3847 RepID=A0A0R0HBY2_SOYBN|nr:hypothetical protein JHK87_033676 [Glycine soja]KAG4980492.1 hypothetical protein JHK85_034450 [Glycine max]KAG4986125.1 hypothetical protein JHK86_033816 [Glycine max]KAG5119312.1 hypothetical protein JHK82_033732 [Glycine max]KAG5140304.1 hypothetical protein JHK84_034072 [Glycine max]
MTCYMMHTTCLHFVAGSILAHCQCIMKTKAFKRSRSHDFLQVLPLVGLWLDLQWPCLCFTL